MRVRAMVAAVSLLVGLAAIAQTPAPPGQQAPTGAQGLIAPGRSPELEILFTGDVIGFIEPCG